MTVDLGPTLIVRATSPGRSLLILPFDYSHCLRLEAAGGGARLIPVNLQQTGLLFEERVEAKNYLSVRAVPGLALSRGGSSTRG